MKFFTQDQITAKTADERNRAVATLDAAADEGILLIDLTELLAAVAKHAPRDMDDDSRSAYLTAIRYVALMADMSTYRLDASGSRFEVNRSAPVLRCDGGEVFERINAAAGVTDDSHRAEDGRAPVPTPELVLSLTAGQVERITDSWPSSHPGRARAMDSVFEFLSEQQIMDVERPILYAARIRSTNTRQVDALRSAARWAALAEAAKDRITPDEYDALTFLWSQGWER